LLFDFERGLQILGHLRTQARIRSHDVAWQIILTTTEIEYIPNTRYH